MELPDDTELKRRLIAFRGRKIERPKPGSGKSVQFRMWDIALLSRMPPSMIYQYLIGRRNWKPLTKTRVYRTLLLIEQGLVTKTQHGVYHFHDEPQRPPVRVMKIDLGTGRITQEKEDSIPRLPSFRKTFGG